MAVNVSLLASGLACERDDRWLFQSLDLRVEDGDILRIEGANGSGKTTLLKLLTGQMSPTEGRLEWHGESLSISRDAFLAQLLYIGHAPGVSATGQETPQSGDLYGRLDGVEVVDSATLALDIDHAVP